GLLVLRRPASSGFGFFISKFFFSSRSRHTRIDCDWSSDVCSSELQRTDAHDGRVELIMRIGTLVQREGREARRETGNVAKRLPRSEERREGKSVERRGRRNFIIKRKRIQASSSRMLVASSLDVFVA